MQAILSPYITLAQSTANPALFRPVSVDIAGRAKSLPVNIRQHTIPAMATACQLYALKYGMDVRFDLAIIRQDPPEHIQAQLAAIGADTRLWGGAPECVVHVPADPHPAIVAELSKVPGVVLVQGDPTVQQWQLEGSPTAGATWSGDYSDCVPAEDRDDYIGF